MEYSSINLIDKFSMFSEHWSPKVIAEMNHYQFKLVKVQGDFVWHRHNETDEVFIVVLGEVTIEFRDGHVKLSEGELFVIPKGKEHKPYSTDECCILLVEPKGVVNTGDSINGLTAKNDVWV